MTGTSGDSAGSKGSPGAKGPDELRRQIEMTRHQLGDTVEELVAKTDVKARARQQVAGWKGSAVDAAHSVRERVPHMPRAVVIGGVGVGVGVAAAATGVAARRRQGVQRFRGFRGRRGSSALRGDLARRASSMLRGDFGRHGSSVLRGDFGRHGSSVLRGDFRRSVHRARRRLPIVG